MNLKARAWIHTVLSIIGMIVLVYLSSLIIDLDNKELDLSTLAVFTTVALVIVAAIVANFYLAAAFGLGRAGKVKGSVKSATIVKNEEEVKIGVRLYAVKELNKDSDLDSNTLVFFIAGLRPWICMKNSFLKE
jgi:hypothetical protein